MTYVCRDTVPRLGDLAEHALSPDERDAVERHLTICPRCRELAASLAALPNALRDLFEVHPPRDLVERLLAGLSGARRLP